ncbi:hypothetical protein V2J09_010013 [Rumex salicifolius]
MTPWPLLLISLVVAMSPHAVDARSPALHRVGGGKFSWKVGVNFTDWSSHERFFVGDWLYFGFDKHNYSVLEVNRTGYDHCVEKGFIANITRGGRDVFNLTDSRPYFFISGHGFCSQGVKVAVNVLVGDDSAVSSAAGVSPSLIFLFALLYLVLHICS